MNLPLPRLDQYEWFGVGKYLSYLEITLALVPINANDVWSVRVTSSFCNLLAKKRRVRDAVAGNKESLICFQERVELNINERGVVAALIGNYDFYIDILQEQIVTLEELSRASQKQLFYEPFDDSEPLF